MSGGLLGEESLFVSKCGSEPWQDAPRELAKFGGKKHLEHNGVCGMPHTLQHAHVRSAVHATPTPPSAPPGPVPGPPAGALVRGSIAVGVVLGDPFGRGEQLLHGLDPTLPKDGVPEPYRTEPNRSAPHHIFVYFFFGGGRGFRTMAPYAGTPLLRSDRKTMIVHRRSARGRYQRKESLMHGGCRQGVQDEQVHGLGR